MTRTASLCGAFLTVAAMACSTVAPVKINAGEQCFRCRRTIVDTNMAAERITGFVEKFKGAGCMAKYLAAHPEETGPIFVTDYPSGDMMSPDNAFFVPVVVDDVTNETDYRAYQRKADADKAAAELHTAAIDWTSVLDRARQAL